MDPLDLEKTINRNPPRSLSEQLSRMEPWIALLLSVHGAILLYSSGGSIEQWGAVLFVAVLGLWGLSGRGIRAHSILIRAVIIGGVTWLLMLTSGGVNSFFLLWYFVLLSFYIFLLPSVAGTLFLLFLPLSYLLLLFFAPSPLPMAGVISRVFLLFFLGSIAWFLNGMFFRYLAEARQRAAALQEREQQFRILVDQAADGIFIANAQGKYVDVNSSGCRMLGYTREELLQMGIKDLLPPEKLQNNPLLLDQLQEGKSLITQRELRRKDGTLLPVEISAKMLPDGRLLGIVRDITNRRKAEEALRASEARFRQLIAHAPEAIVLLEVDTGRFVHGNPAAERLFKLPADQLYRVGPAEMSPPVQPDGQPSTVKSREYISRACAGDTPVFEWTHRDATGKDILCEVRLLYLEVDGRKLVRGSITDITERRLAEQKLRQSEQRLAFLLQATPAIIYTAKVGGDFATTFVSDNITKQTGYTPRDFYEDPDFWRKHIHPEDQPGVMQSLEKLLEQGEQITEYRFRFKDGQYHWMQDAVRVVRDETGVPQEMVGYWLEITDRRRAEAALRESEEKYRQLFLSNPHPMWVSDRDTLAFLAVNEAAIAKYGYSRREFLQMTIKDIRPAADVPKLEEAVRNFTDGPGKGGIWRHRLKNGKIIYVSIHSHSLMFEGKRAVLVSAMDVTDQVRAEQDIQRTNRELTALLEVSKSLAGQIDLQKLLQDIPRHIVETISAAEAGSVWLYDEEKNVMAPTAWIGHDENEISGLQISPETSLVGLIFRTRMPQNIPNASKNQHFSRLGKPAMDQVKSVIGAPLLLDGELIGALFADNYARPHAFDDNDLRLLESLANLVVLAIKNARLYEERLTSEKRLRASREQLRALTGHLQNVREEERGNIARELHDEFGQILTVLKLNLSFLQQNLTLGDGVDISHVQKEFESMNELIDRSASVISRMISKLRPEVLEHLGLVEAIEWQAQEFEKVSGISCIFQNDAGNVSLGKEKETAIFRIVQEALTNVTRHARASQVQIKIEREEPFFVVQISDNGIGISPPQIDNSGRFGLLGMKERAILLGGKFAIQTAQGQGTTIKVKIPVVRQSARL